jgi:hypothetical protein
MPQLLQFTAGGYCGRRGLTFAYLDYKLRRAANPAGQAGTTAPESEQEDTLSRRQLAPRPHSARLHAGEFGPDLNPQMPGVLPRSRLRPLVEDVPVGQSGDELCLGICVKQSWWPINRRPPPQPMSPTSHRRNCTTSNDYRPTPAPWPEMVTIASRSWRRGNGQGSFPAFSLIAPHHELAGSKAAQLGAGAARRSGNSLVRLSNSARRRYSGEQATKLISQ